MDACLTSPRSTRRVCHVLDQHADVLVRAASADVATHPTLDVFGRIGVALGDARDSGHDLPGRAVAALKRVAFDEGGLQGMELAAFCQPLNRRDLPLVDERCE